MTTFEFPCRCGQTLGVPESQVKRGGKVRCPHCQALLEIPADIVAEVEREQAERAAELAKTEERRLRRERKQREAAEQQKLQGEREREAERARQAMQVEAGRRLQPAPATKSSPARKGYEAIGVLSGILSVLGWIALLIGAVMFVVAIVWWASEKTGAGAMAAAGLGLGVPGFISIVWAELLEMARDATRDIRRIATRLADFEPKQ